MFILQGKVNKKTEIKYKSIYFDSICDLVSNINDIIKMRK